MSTILHLIEQPYNYLYGFFILLSIGIWLVTVVGFLSMSALDGLFDFALDVDMDHDVDLDVDHDVDLDHDVDAGHFGGLGALLSFLGFGKVPVTLIVTLLMFIHGSFGITFNYFLYKYQLLPEGWRWAGVVVGIILTFIIALYATAYLVRPLYPFFKDYGVAEKSEDMVGKTASITSGKATSTFGQARIKIEGGESVEVTVRVLNDAEIQYGERVIVVDYDKEKNIYYVESDKALE